MALIFFLSSLSSKELSNLPSFSDILGHSLLYFVLAVLLYFSFHRSPAVWAVVVSALYGLSDEFHQSFVPGRTPEVKDLAVDIAAALAAVIVIRLAKKLRQ